MADVIWAQLRIDADQSKKEIKSLNAELAKNEKASVSAGRVGSAAFDKEATSVRKVTSEMRELNNAASRTGGTISSNAKIASNSLDTVAKKTTGFKNSLGSVTSGLGGIKSSVSSLVPALGGLAAAMGVAFSVDKVIAFGKESVEAFIDAEKNAQLLLFALKGNEAAQGRLLAQASQIQEDTIFDDDSIQQAQTFLANQGRTEEQIKKVIEAAIELSTVTGVDLNTAVMQLDGTFEGTIGRLAKLDSGFKDLTPQQLANGAAADLLIEKYGGVAKAMGDTTSGKVAKLKNQFGELKEAVGAELIPSLTGLMSMLTNLKDGNFGDAFKDLFKIPAGNSDQFKRLLENIGVLSYRYVETLTDQEKAQLEIIAATDDELKVKRDLIAAQNGNTEAFDKYVQSVREGQVAKTFEQLSRVLDITEKQYEGLTEISDKYNISARISADLILGIGSATREDLDMAFQKFNKTLGVTREDFDEYIGKVKQIKPLQEDLGNNTDKNMVGPYDTLSKSLSDINKKMLDYITLGKDAVLLDRLRFQTQEKINEVLKEYNRLLDTHVPIQKADNDVVAQGIEAQKLMFEALVKTLEPVRQLPNDLAAVTKASEDQVPIIEDLGDTWQKISEISGALADLGENLSNALTQIFGEAAQDSAVFAAFQKSIAIATITFKSFEAIASGIASIAGSGGDPVKIISGIAVIVSGIGNLIGGLIQEANATPIPTAPSFFDGTGDTGPGGNVDSRGGFWSILHPHEGVLNADGNAKYPGLANAINIGKGDEYIMSHFVRPNIEAEKASIAEKLAASMLLQQNMDFDDKNLTKIGKTQISLLAQNNLLLKQSLRKHNNRNLN